MRIATLWVLGLGALLGVAAAAPGDAPNEATADRLVAELAGVNRSLSQLVALAGNLRQNQEIELMLRRIELKERRLAPLEGRLRGVEDDALNAKTEIDRMQAMIGRAEEDLEAEIRNGADPQNAMNRQLVEELQAHVKGETERLEDLIARQRRLEDELAEGRNEIAILDEQLDDLLE